MGIRRARILIVEDEGIVALDLQRRVTRLGHEVIGPVASADAAIRSTAESQPDLVLMDIRLKGDVDRVTAAERCRTPGGIQHCRERDARLAAGRSLSNG